MESNIKKNIKDIQKLKNAPNPFVAITAYDFPSAQIINDLEIPITLVGDSASMVVYGYKDTTSIDMEEMLLITKAVARGLHTSLLVGDMPFMSYQPSIELAIKNAGRFIKEGKVDAVKLEGGREYLAQIREIIKAGIPVMGHIGLKPQSVLINSGYQIQGKNMESAIEIYKDALALEKVGIFALVLEGVPTELAEIITRQLSIPTIGIGAGAKCDGQIQVWHDIIGLYNTKVPRHAHMYGNINKQIKETIMQYVKQVTAKKFPSKSHSVTMDSKEIKKLKSAIENI